MPRLNLSRLLSLTLITGMSVLIGCNGDEAASNGNVSQQQSTPQAAGPKMTMQAMVVDKFLQAALKGDRDSARKLLTAKAIQKIDEYQLPFLPGAIETGSFRVGSTSKDSQQGGYVVDCVWMDKGPDGQTTQEKIRWIVKPDGPTKWGISGMMFRPDPAGDVQVINFEQPDLLVQRQRELSQQQQQAAQPPRVSTLPPQKAGNADPFQNPPRR